MSHSLPALVSIQRADAATDHDLWLRKTVLVWVSLLPIGLLLIIVLPSLLPYKYTLDAQVIRDFMFREDRPVGFVLFESFANTAYLYILLGIEADPVAASWFTYVTAWASVLVALLLARNGGRLWLWFPAFVWHFLLVVFTCQHSKELHALPALALLLVLCGRRFTRLRVATLAAVIVGYAVYFRSYWVVVALLAFAFIVLRRRIERPLRLAFAMIAAYALLFAGYHVVTGHYLTDIRVDLTNNRDIDQFSDTLFTNALVNDGLVSDLLNGTYSFLRLIFPLSLLITGKIQHLAFVVWELFNVPLFAWLFARVWRSRQLDARTEFAAAWILAFSLTQGVFEPDYGTFLRHQTMLLPAFALMYINALWPGRGQRPAPAAGVSRGEFA